MPARSPTPLPWRPTRLTQVVESYDTSTGTTKIRTDASLAYIKVLGNRQGPHALASELVGTALARWFGLTVPDWDILDISAEACFDLPRGNRAAPGPAFVSRHVPGRTWGGSATELDDLENLDDLTRLVVFDTWVRNCDRHPPDLATRKPNYANVYLADTDRPGRSRLVAIDHTHCFDCGRDFSEHLSDIDKVKDEATYGLFPTFTRFLDPGTLAWAKATLGSLTAEVMAGVLSQVPPR
jgi:HipA-like kinase